jgi:hypothetical protein
MDRLPIEKFYGAKRIDAFFQEPDRLIRIPVKSRIMINAGLFRKSNPSYPRLFTKKSDGIDLIL